MSNKEEWHAGHIGEDEYRRECVFDRDGHQICEVAGKGPAAVALASKLAAVPDLIAACEATISAIKGYEQRTGVRQLGQTWETVRAAIARALATHRVTRDRVEVYRSDEAGCWAWLHNRTSSSVDWACKHEGYAVEVMQ